ncbi:DUF86 domain-containing protein [Candidatus Margulisiibacteriota bacterium]
MNRDKTYEKEIRNHIEKVSVILKDLSEKNDYSITDYLAIERALQILIESFIGICRYFIRTKYNLKLSKSGESLNELFKRNIFSKEDFDKYKRIIGYRNILVHDYLNLNPDVTYNILKKKEYLDIKSAQEKLLSLL